MLMPSKVKYRKQQRGRMKGKATRGSTLAFGDVGLQILEPGWITARQIEAARIAVVKPGRILYEMEGLDETQAREALELAADKIGLKTRFITRHSQMEMG